MIEIKTLRNDIKNKLEVLLADKLFDVPPKNPEKPVEEQDNVKIFLGYLPISNSLQSVTPGIGIRSKGVKILSDKKQVSIVIEAILYGETAEKRCEEMETLLETIANSFQPQEIYGDDYFVIEDAPIEWEIADSDLDPYIIGSVEVLFIMPQTENTSYIELDIVQEEG
ncbi:MAG: hypothetical protein ACRC0V_11590 [Fusobacteriaceae bacterium]